MSLLDAFIPRWAQYLAGTAIVAGGCYYVADLVGDAREARVKALYERKIQAAVDESVRQATRLQGRVDDANAKYQAAMADVDAAGQRIDALNRRVRNAGPSPGAIARSTPAALGQYAAEIAGDFSDCRDRYAAMGRVAAGASEAAWAHRLAWPGWDAAVKDFDNKLKGMK